MTTPWTPQVRSVRRRRAEAFTLIELILVMSMLLIALSVSAPSLSRFFRGRHLDLEARRFLALTRHGQARAVTEGIPMLLWIDARQGYYGLQAESSYLEADPQAVEFTLHENLSLELEQTEARASFRPQAVTGFTSVSTNTVASDPVATAIIRFQPDGFLGDASPEFILLREGENDLVRIGLNRNRLNYDILTNSWDQPISTRLPLQRSVRSQRP